MSDRLKELRERSQKRKQLLAQAFGVASPDGLKSVLKSKEERECDAKSVKSLSSASDSPPAKVRARSTDETTGDHTTKADKDGDQGTFEKDEVYRDSSTFLKGTQSANPHNDYCQNCVDTGERPQNFIRDVGLAMRFEEYPKLRELIRLKDELIATTNIPPIYKKCDLESFELSELNCQFDVILVEPPLEEYQRRGAVFDKYWDWDEIQRLDIPSVAAQRSFIWVWCGNAEGLERGRKCLKQWGYRRCEDICWIKTNIQNPGHNKNLEPNSVIQRTKEHCLMGIKGTVKRSTDGDFIHANVDIDLIIEDEPPYGTKDKPIEIFHMIEHFCLGRRRLHVFARDSTIRPGWLSLGSELSSSNYEPDIYHSYFQKEQDLTTGCSDEIERLRPKSPNPKSKQFSGAQRGRGGRGSGPMMSRPGRGLGRGGMRGGPNRGMRGMRGPPRGFHRGAR